MSQSLEQKYSSATTALLKVIPSAEVDLVIGKGQQYSMDQWWWGRKAIQWIKYALGSGLLLTKNDAITALAQVSGIKKKTLDRYRYIAKFYPEEIQEYYEPLPFSHFETAKKFGEDWTKILKFSMDFLEDNHRTCSAEFLEYKFSKRAEPELEQDQRLEKTQIEFDREHLGDWSLHDPGLEPEEDEPVASQTAARDWIQKMDKAIWELMDAVELLPVSKNAKEEIDHALRGLSNTFITAIKEIAVPDPAHNQNPVIRNEIGAESHGSEEMDIT